MYGARRHLPSLPSLLALEAVDRLGSASAAANELALTQGAISRQLQVLEAQMGAALFQRIGGRLVITSAARDYAASARQALQALDSAGRQLRANPMGSSLNMAILPAFGAYWLAPRLAAFKSLHPDISLNLTTRLRPFDMGSKGFDCAIHYGREDWVGADHLPLLDEALIAVAAPSLITAPLARADDILSYPLMQLDSRTGDWGRWLAHFGAANQRPAAMMFDQFSTMATAATHGLGAALLPTFIAKDLLDTGRLIAAHGPAIPASGRYYLVWPKGAPARAPFAAFQSWIARAAE
ncbi:MAG: LysR family transcriptional regulator [Cypionkella sp.]|nr:LysR family transcriptional regulator [Cypionkella sp.]